MKAEYAWCSASVVLRVAILTVAVNPDLFFSALCASTTAVTLVAHSVRTKAACFTAVNWAVLPLPCYRWRTGMDSPSKSTGTLKIPLSFKPFGSTCQGCVDLSSAFSHIKKATVLQAAERPYSCGSCEVCLSVNKTKLAAV